MIDSGHQAKIIVVPNTNELSFTIVPILCLVGVALDDDGSGGMWRVRKD